MYDVMRKIFCLILLGGGLFTLVAQVAGISNSKLIAPSSGTVEQGTFEFEPSISVLKFSGYFNDDQHRISLNGDSTSSGFLLRITLGVLDNLEIGTAFSTRVDDIALGLKYRFYESQHNTIALLAGFSFPAGNQFIPDSINNDITQKSVSCGLVCSTVIEKFSLDSYASFSRAFKEAGNYSIINAGFAAGYLITPKFQPVIEIANSTSFGKGVNSTKVTLTPGFTYQFSANLLLIIGAQIDLWGRNETNGVTEFAAFTMTFK